MFVGNNLDSAASFQRRLELGIPHGDPDRPMQTWRNLYRLLETAALDPRRCFFTNAYVGLIAGSQPVGTFPGASDAEFSAWCAGFLGYQLDVMRPSVIVALGTPARRFVRADS